MTLWPPPKNSLAHFALLASPQLIRALLSFTSLASGPQRPGVSGPQLTDDRHIPVGGVRVEMVPSCWFTLPISLDLSHAKTASELSSQATLLELSSGFAKKQV